MLPASAQYWPSAGQYFNGMFTELSLNDLSLVVNSTGMRPFRIFPDFSGIPDFQFAYILIDVYRSKSQPSVEL